MSAMTSRERLLAAIRFEGPDRVPVSPRFWRYMLRHGGTQRTEAVLDYAQRFDFDPLIHVAAGPVRMVPPPGSDLSRIGGDIRTDVQRETAGEFTVVRRTFETPAGRLTEEVHVPKPGGQFGIAPNDLIKEHIVKGPDDLPALKLVVEAWTAASSVPDFAASQREIGERGLVMANTYSALSHNAGDAYPVEQMMLDCYDRPDFVRALIDVFYQPLMDVTRKALERGAEVVFCSTFFESMSSGWSPALYREFFLPRIRQHVELAHAAGALYHLYDDGKVAGSIGMLHELGVDLLSTLCPPPSGDITPAEARGVVGKDMCFNGGIDTVNTVWRGTPESIDAAICHAIEGAALPGGGYILGTSDSISEEVSEENFAAYFAAGRRHGTLPRSH